MLPYTMLPYTTMLPYICTNTTDIIIILLYVIAVISQDLPIYVYVYLCVCLASGVRILGGCAPFGGFLPHLPRGCPVRLV